MAANDREAVLLAGLVRAKPPLPPVVNLNGDSGENLSAKLWAAHEAALALEEALSECHPHGRNYQTYEDGEKAIREASAAHWEVREAANRIRDYLALLVGSLSNQGYWKGEKQR